MKTIEQIRKECIEIDICNLLTYDEKDIMDYYNSMPINELLNYYYYYMGLRDISDSDREYYAIDIKDLIQ
jgi:hypothetical protein